MSTRSPTSGNLKLRSDPREIHPAREKVLEAVRSLEYDEEHLFAITVALEEALANAILHGNGGDPGKTVHLSFQVDAAEVRISVTDEGEGFECATVPDPTTPSGRRETGGRGLMLMRSYMDEVSYSENGTCLTLTRKKDRPAD